MLLFNLESTLLEWSKVVKKKSFESSYTELFTCTCVSDGFPCPTRIKLSHPPQLLQTVGESQ